MKSYTQNYFFTLKFVFVSIWLLIYLPFDEPAPESDNRNWYVDARYYTYLLRDQQPAVLVQSYQNHHIVQTLLSIYRSLFLQLRSHMDLLFMSC